MKELLGRVKDSVNVFIALYIRNWWGEVIVGEENGFVSGGNVAKGVARFYRNGFAGGYKLVKGRELLFIDRVFLGYN